MSQILIPMSLDPITLGHLNVVRKFQNSFNQVVVGIAENNQKKGVIPPEDRLELAKKSLPSDVEVIEFSGITVKKMKELGISVMGRGLRTAQDLDYEIRLLHENTLVAKAEGFELTCLFALADEQYSRASSTAARDLIAARVPQSVLEELVPKPVAEYCVKKLY